MDCQGDLTQSPNVLFFFHIENQIGNDRHSVHHAVFVDVQGKFNFIFIARQIVPVHRNFGAYLMVALRGLGDEQKRTDVECFQLFVLR